MEQNIYLIKISSNNGNSYSIINLTDNELAILIRFAKINNKNACASPKMEIYEEYQFYDGVVLPVGDNLVKSEE